MTMENTILMKDLVEEFCMDRECCDCPMNRAFNKCSMLPLTRYLADNIRENSEE